MTETDAAAAPQRDDVPFKLAPDDVAAVMAVCPDVAKPNSGALYEDGTLRVPRQHAGAVQTAVSDLAGSRKRMLRQIAASIARREERKAVTVDGIAISTDDRAALLADRIAADADKSFTSFWPTPDGGGYQLDAARIIKISNAVFEQIRDCRAKAAKIASDIDSGKVTSQQEIEQRFA
jgi:hypothetical protein